MSLNHRSRENKIWKKRGNCVYVSELTLGIGDSSGDNEVNVSGKVKATDIIVDSITFNNLSQAPTDKTNKMYVVNGNLYFGNNLVSLSLL